MNTDRVKIPPFLPVDFPGWTSLQRQVLEILNALQMRDKEAITFTRDYRPDAFEQIRKIPELNAFLDSWGLQDSLHDLIINVIGPDGSFDIHEDPKLPEVAHHRILIPILNCKNTYTQFYATDKRPSVFEYISDDGDVHPYLRFDESDCELTHRLELTSPHIVNTTPPHGVINLNNSFRINLWLDFNTRFNKIAQDYFIKVTGECWP